MSFYQDTMINIPIIYEADDFLAINKPAGLAVHGDSHSSDQTLVDWILANRPECRGVGESMKLDSGEVIDRPGIVHRLDKDTSGILLIAKKQSAYDWLKTAFQNHDIKKTYQALVYGNFKEEEGVIESAIGRSRKDPRVRSAYKQAVGKLRAAKTNYRVVKQFPGYSSLEVRPETGRTHQIRVHLKFISHPIVCDSLYAPGRECLPGLGRQALHAKSLEFKSPEGEVFHLEAETPTDFISALDYLASL